MLLSLPGVQPSTDQNGGAPGNVLSYGGYERRQRGERGPAAQFLVDLFVGTTLSLGAIIAGIGGIVILSVILNVVPWMSPWFDGWTSLAPAGVIVILLGGLLIYYGIQPRTRWGLLVGLSLGPVALIALMAFVMGLLPW